MKTKEELNALKNEVEALNKKLLEPNEEELKQVTGGTFTMTGGNISGNTAVSNDKDTLARPNAEKPVSFDPPY